MQRKAQFFMALRWVCFSVLLTAVVFRLAGGMDWHSLQEQISPQPTEAAQPSEASPDFPTLYYQAPEDEQPYAPAVEAANISIRKPTEAELDLTELLSRPLNFNLAAEGPLVLIVHTHATEAYTPTDDDNYSPYGDYHTLDTAYNVVRVGQALTDRLNQQGIPTIHDSTLNDVPGYDDAYERTADIISAYLEEYPGIQMVIDVHRDSVTNDDGEELALSTDLDGETAAKLLLVMGSDLAGLEHPNWKGNLSFALQLQAYCQTRAPDLFRELALRTQRYNEHLTPNSILLEVGAAGNTLQEAIRSAEFFADRLAELLLSVE